MRILSADDVAAALPMEAAIAGMKRALAALASGGVEAPVLSNLAGPGARGEASAAPVRVRTTEGEAFGVRVATRSPADPDQGSPASHAALLLIDPATGRPEALLEGDAISTIRTGATSAVATEMLARRSSRTLAILGTGVQARTQVEAVCHVRAIERVLVYGRDYASARRFAAEIAGRGPVPQDVVVERSPAAAVGSADVVCTATSSSTPVFADRELLPGVHINGVGSVTPGASEIPHRTIARALLVVDSRTAVLAEAGDVIQAIAQGAITPGHIHAELGELVLGRVEGRTSSEQVTIFKSVGLACQDTVAAAIALKRAREQEIGREVRWA